MPDGNCRLTALFTAQLSETTLMWGRAVAPIAELVTRAVWSSSAKLSREPAPPTRLTLRTKREAKGAEPPPLIKTPRRDNLCSECGRRSDLRAPSALTVRSMMRRRKCWRQHGSDAKRRTVLKLERSTLSRHVRMRLSRCPCLSLDLPSESQNGMRARFAKDTVLIRDIGEN